MIDNRYQHRTYSMDYTETPDDFNERHYVRWNRNGAAALAWALYASQLKDLYLAGGELDEMVDGQVMNTACLSRVFGRYDFIPVTIL